jgi:hypothetical protein
MAIKISTGLRTALMGTSGMKTLLDGGFMKIYSGGQPTTADYTETGTLLATISTTSGTGGLIFGTAAAGQLPKSYDTWSGVIVAAGVAGYFRIYGTAGTSGSSSSEKRIDGAIGTVSADMSLSNNSLTVGATVTIDSFYVELPAS